MDEPTDTDVQHLAHVITDARDMGVVYGPHALARLILNAGYRRHPAYQDAVVDALLCALDGDPYPFLLDPGELPVDAPLGTCEDCGRSVRHLTPVWDGTRAVLVGPRCWRKRMAVPDRSADQLQLTEGGDARA